MFYIQLAVLPVIVILTYIYYRDKYNREPLGLLVLLFLSGAFSVLPILGVGYLSDYFAKYFTGLQSAAYTAFIQAAFIEEFFKLFFVFIIAWWHKAFDERFDGIVYAVYVSMGFAMVENIMYVLGYGYVTGFLRLVTAVPAHAIFGISMGYYLGRAKFDKNFRAIYLFLAFFVPWLLHGIYNFLIMAGYDFLLIAFVVFLIFMYILGFRKLRIMSKYKVKPEPPHQPNSNNFASMEDNQENVQHQESQNIGFNMGEGIGQEKQAYVPTNQTYSPPQPSAAQGVGFYPGVPLTDNLETISIFHFVWGGLKILAAFFVLIYVFIGGGMLFSGMQSGETELQIAGGFFVAFGIIFFVIIVAFAILNILCGKYLREKKNRTFCMVISILVALNAPLGTILGVFTIMEIEKPHVKAMFEANSEK